MKITVKLNGTKELQKQLAQFGANAEKELGGAMFREATTIMNASKVIVPVDTGALKNSGIVMPPERTGTGVMVSLGYGGAARDYAIYVHENLTARHAPPTRAKFLEDPLMAASKGMAGRLVEDLKKALR